MFPMTWASTARRCAKRSGRPKPIAAGEATCLSSQEREEIKKLRRENFELRRANEILKSGSVFFAKELDPDRTK
jgi:transposase-like protein